MRANVARRWMRWCVVLAVACGGGNQTEGPQTIKRRYETDVNVIAINTSEGDVRLEGADTRVVEVTFIPSRDGDNFQGEPAGGRLSLGSVCQDGSLGCGGNFSVVLPRDTEFEITTETGAVFLLGMGFRGTVDTLVGTITGEGLGQIELEVAGQDTDQDLHFRLQPVRVDMDGGTSGDLTVRLPSNADYQFDLATNGSITFEDGSVRDASFGPVINMNTGTGNIVITGN